MRSLKSPSRIAPGGVPASRRRKPLPAFASISFALLIGLCLCGCGGDARVEMAAADALEAAASEIRLAFDEYTSEVELADQAREAAAIAAFVRRLQADAGDEHAVEAHAAAFTEAMRALRADMRAEWQRYTTATGNVEAVEEIAAGLRRVSIATLTVSDDVRRYLGSLIDARHRARRAASGEANHE